MPYSHVPHCACREVGISLASTRMYAKQMFIGLHHMIKCQVVHGDIKLDNILVTKDLKTVQICDFGTAGKTFSKTCMTRFLFSQRSVPCSTFVILWSPISHVKLVDKKHLHS